MPQWDCWSLRPDEPARGSQRHDPEAACLPASSAATRELPAPTCRRPKPPREAHAQQPRDAAILRAADPASAAAPGPRPAPPAVTVVPGPARGLGFAAGGGAGGDPEPPACPHGPHLAGPPRHADGVPGGPDP